MKRIRESVSLFFGAERQIILCLQPFTRAAFNGGTIRASLPVRNDVFLST